MKTAWKKYLPFPVLLLAAACTVNQGESVPGTESSGISDPRLHAVMSERLDVLQRQLLALGFEQHRTVTELDDERRRRAVAVARQAQQMQKAVDSILEIQPALGLDAEAAGEFVRLANRLQTQAAELEAQAHNAEAAAFPASLERMNATCNACHALYRGP